MKKHTFGTTALAFLLAIMFAMASAAQLRAQLFEFPYLDPDNTHGTFTTDDGTELGFYKQGGGETSADPPAPNSDPPPAPTGVVPEPATSVLLFGLLLTVGLALLARRFRKR